MHCEFDERQHKCAKDSKQLSQRTNAWPFIFRRLCPLNEHMDRYVSDGHVECDWARMCGQRAYPYPIAKLFLNPMQSKRLRFNFILQLHTFGLLRHGARMCFEKKRPNHKLTWFELWCWYGELHGILERQCDSRIINGRARNTNTRRLRESDPFSGISRRALRLCSPRPLRFHFNFVLGMKA